MSEPFGILCRMSEGEPEKPPVKLAATIEGCAAAMHAYTFDTGLRPDEGRVLAADWPGLLHEATDALIGCGVILRGARRDATIDEVAAVLGLARVAIVETEPRADYQGAGYYQRPFWRPGAMVPDWIATRECTCGDRSGPEGGVCGNCHGAIPGYRTRGA